MNGIILTTEENLRTVVIEAIESLLTKRTPEPILSDNIGIDEAVELLIMSGYLITKGTVYKLTHKGTIPHKKFGSKLVFSRKELVQWAESQCYDRSKENSKSVKLIADSINKNKN